LEGDDFLYSIDDLTVTEFLKKMSEPGFPRPLSGSAMAMTAAMAAALLEMGYRVTMKRDETKSYLVESLKNIEAVRRHCLYIANEDMNAFPEVMKAAKSKKEFPEEYETAVKNATETLAAIVKDCSIILTQLEQFAGVCHKPVLGDLAGSAYMAEAAGTAAKRVVEINLRMVRDEEYKRNTVDSVNENYKNILEAKDRIIAAIFHE
jgi:formiminotetrahydrofolate cyclodeaminase